MKLVQDFLTTDLFETNKFEVIATLSDQSKGWTAFTVDEFNFELLSESNKDHKGMHLDDILDLAERFHVMEYKEEGWSVVDWGCSCVDCYKHVHCCHNILFGIDFLILIMLQIVIL